MAAGGDGEGEDDAAAVGDVVGVGVGVGVRAAVEVRDGARHCVASPEGAVPAAHGAHAGEPGSIATVPAPQRAHATALVEPLPDVVPAGQGAQSVTRAPPVPARKVPRGQGTAADDMGGQ